MWVLFSFRSTLYTTVTGVLATVTEITTVGTTDPAIVPPRPGVPTPDVEITTVATAILVMGATAVMVATAVMALATAHCWTASLWLQVVYLSTHLAPAIRLQISDY